MNLLDPDIKTLYKLILNKDYIIYERQLDEYLFVHLKGGLTIYVLITNRVEVSLCIEDEDKYWKQYYK